jgi:SEC-C motif-containing protein
MSSSDNCPCCSGLVYENCCFPLISQQKKAETPEQLMRSRYSAYAKVEIDYLINTTHVSTRKHFSRKEIENWATTHKWIKLVVLNSSESTVEFNAHFIEGLNSPQIHHERSNFVQEKGVWYYVDAY